MKREVNLLDLFCGGGGFTTGMALAMKRLGLRGRELAINHWHIAVGTMRANYPDMDVRNMDLESVVPGEILPFRKIDLLVASPSCTHHSRAKGGRPCSKQLRAQPDLIPRWLDESFVARFIIENVPEFLQWAPLGTNLKPLKSMIEWRDARSVCGADSGKVRVGSCFVAWIESIKARNYNVEWKIINCADYGDATSRKRLFVKAVRKGCGKIRWPEPTHAKNPESSVLTWNLKRWRGAREIIDFSDTGRSIFNRKEPLADNTLTRVQVGLSKYDGIELDLISLFRDGESPCKLSFDEKGGMPFMVRLNRHGTAEGVDTPLSVVAAGGQHHMLCTPYIVRSNKGCFAESIDAPLSSQQASTVHHAIAQPIIVDHFHKGRASDGSEPLGAQTTHDRYSVATPFIVEHHKNGKAKPIDGPLGVQTTKDKFSFCTPLILGQHGGGQARPVDEPCPTIATAGALRLVTTVVLDKGTGLPRLPDGRFLDIRIRMLKPSELAAAHSFPEDYVLTGNRMQQVKQIGNSVPVLTAAAMCQVDLEEVA